jgi:hypothetical protein
MTYESPIQNSGKVQAVCALTGRAGRLKLAHIVPASTSEDIRRVLKLPDDETGIWSCRNVLLLCCNIERAFDSLRISFSSNPLNERVYTMRVWDFTVRSELIWENATRHAIDGDNTIGHYETHGLQLRLTNDLQLDPFKRALCYQEFMCFARSRLPSDQCPRDFSSDIGEDWIMKRNDLLVIRSSLDKVIENETAATAGDDASDSADSG